MLFTGLLVKPYFLISLWIKVLTESDKKSIIYGHYNDI